MGLFGLVTFMAAVGWVVASGTATPEPLAVPLPSVNVMQNVAPASLVTPVPRVYTGVPGASAPLDAVEWARINRTPAAPTPEPSPFAPILEGRLLVGSYGTPAGRGLGPLGTLSPQETISLTLQQAAAYQALLTDTEVIPFFHMVVVIADRGAGSGGDYSHRAAPETVQLWIDAARNAGFWCVVDIQPGQSPIMRELAYVEPFVRQPNVHLALDSEFFMPDPSWIPGYRVGRMDGETVNQVQAWLNDIAAATGERKILIIHQFDDSMFVGKETLQDYPLVELVWDADGVGAPSPKIADYLEYAASPGFEYGGFKLFYHYDEPLLTPEEVLALEPRPVLVIYQ